MLQFMFSAFAMLFSADFWKNAFVAFIIFIIFSLFVRYMVIKTNKYFLVKKFFLYYPIIALVTIIPVSIYIQFYNAIKSAKGDNFALVGVVLYFLAYFYLNILISAVWFTGNICVKFIKGGK